MGRKKKEEVTEITGTAGGSIQIPPIEKRVASLTIEGDSPLLINRFSEKCRREIDEKQQKRAAKAREARDPEAEYQASMYRMSKNRLGIPASGLKNCAVSACKFIDGVKMTTARGAFFVLEEENGLVEVTPLNGGPIRDERVVRVGPFGSKKPMTRYRCRLDEWECTFKVMYNPRVISPSQLVNLYENAGFSIGLCEYRPEKTGNLGMFHVKRG